MASNDNTPIVQAVAVSEIRGADATPLLEAIPAEAAEYSPFATTEAVAADQRRASNAADMRGCRDGAGDAVRMRRDAFLAERGADRGGVRACEGAGRLDAAAATRIDREQIASRRRGS